METPFHTILIDPRSETILEDTSWQSELGTDIRESLWLFLKVDGKRHGRLFAELIIIKSPEDAATEIERYVRLGNIEITTPYRRKGFGSQMINEMERHARQFGALRIEGIISQFDLDNQPLLPEFYTKLGYTLTKDQNGYTFVKFL